MTASLTFHTRLRQFNPTLPRSGFDLIYADAWPGKFTHLDRALSLLNRGGIYFIDDLLPQPNWPEGHAPRVPALIEDLERRSGFVARRWRGRATC